MKKEESIITDLIDELYAAAADDSRWEAVSKCILKSVSADLIFLQVRPRPEDMEILATNIAPQDVRAAGEWARNDPFFAAAQLRPPRCGYLSNELVPARILHHSDYYHECMRTLLDSDDFLGSLTVAPLSAIGLFRGTDARSFSVRERNLLSAVTPHYERALSIRERLRVANASTQIGFAALDALNTPIVVVAGDGSVSFLNRAVERLLARKDGIRLAGPSHRRFLEATSPESNRRLHAVLQGLGNVAKRAASSFVHFVRPEGRASYIASISALPPRYRETCVGGTRLFLIIINDPDASSVTPSESLKGFFGLTSAEANVASALANGTTLAEIAQQNEISVFTVKSHLRKVLEKTGTRRQAEVVRLILKFTSIDIESGE